MDGPAALRNYVIDNFVVEGFTFEDVMSDDDALEAFVRKAAIGVWHASCSCRMGRDDDPMAVVDTQGRVQGRAGPARGRCLDLPGGAVRQHEFPGADDGGEDRRHDDAVTGGRLTTESPGFLRGFLLAPEQRQEKNDRQRNADQPEQCTFS